MYMYVYMHIYLKARPLPPAPLLDGFVDIRIDYVIGNIGCSMNRMDVSEPWGWRRFCFLLGNLGEVPLVTIGASLGQS